MTGTVLIVDDEPNIVSAFSSLLKDEGYRTTGAGSAEEARRLCDQKSFDLILLDLQLPGQGGLEFFRDLKSTTMSPRVLIISGKADIPTALEAVRLGAIDFLEKPVPPEKLIASVSAAMSLVDAERQRTMLVSEIDEQCRIVGKSPAIRKLLATISQVAPADSTVLITGENGTGKELIATRLFLESRRRDKAFLKVNCPGIPETLFESELFGHVKGSFTGAVRDHPGKFVMADGGTIFLDEIGDLPLACQAKLLRVLETGEVETLGLEGTREVNVRVICATNRDLPSLIRDGKFREDLYYRVSVLIIEAPSLASRADDIPLLTGEFLRRFNPAGTTRLSAATLAHLSTLKFPGNVRQLKNLIERLCILYPDREIDVDQIEEHQRPATSPSPPENDDLSLNDRMNQYEKRLIESTLNASRGNISEAARRLKTDRANLSRKIKEFGLRSDDQ